MGKSRYIFPQVLNARLTDKCHVKHDFPKQWAIDHTENHWINQDSMPRFVDQVIIPHFDGVCEQVSLSEINQPSLCILDVFAAHRNADMIAKLK